MSHTTKIQKFTFHHDSWVGTVELIDSDGNHFCVPMSVLTEFVGQKLQVESIQYIEQMTGSAYLRTNR